MKERTKLFRLRQLCLPIAIAVVSCELQGSVDSEPQDATPELKAAPQAKQVPQSGDVPRLKAKREVRMPPKNLDAKLEGMVEIARADLLKRHEEQKLAADDIKLLRAERVNWRSSALGCPQPDRVYPMVVSPGVLIVLRTGGTDFEYHGTLNGPPFLCEPPGRIETPVTGQHSLDPT